MPVAEWPQAELELDLLEMEGFKFKRRRTRADVEDAFKDTATMRYLWLSDSSAFGAMGAHVSMAGCDTPTKGFARSDVHDNSSTSWGKRLRQEEEDNEDAASHKARRTDSSNVFSIDSAYYQEWTIPSSASPHQQPHEDETVLDSQMVELYEIAEILAELELELAGGKGEPAKPDSEDWEGRQVSGGCVGWVPHPPSPSRPLPFLRATWFILKSPWILRLQWTRCNLREGLRASQNQNLQVRTTDETNPGHPL